MDLRCSCGKTLRIADRLLGKHIRCPGCGAKLLADLSQVPDRPPEPTDHGIAAAQAPAQRRPAKPEDRSTVRSSGPRPRREPEPDGAFGFPWLPVGLGAAAATFPSFAESAPERLFETLKDLPNSV